MLNLVEFRCKAGILYLALEGLEARIPPRPRWWTLGFLVTSAPAHPRMSFPALYLTQEGASVRAEIRHLEESDLPAGEILIEVSHSSLNYKDALALVKGAPVVRRFPMVPGIDLAGIVRESSVAGVGVGEAVLVNGRGLGEERWGGFSARQRVPADFLTRVPPGLTPARAMAIGTAGYTAALCVMALERGGLRPGDGEVLVTGAGGGVGGIAILLLAARGYRVTASTGRLGETAYLRELGADTVIDRAGLSAPGKPLQQERWAAAIDSLGGATLANVCASLQAADSAPARQQLLELVNQVLDVDGIARFALGPYSRQATPDQLNKYNQLFHQVISNGVTARLSAYASATFALGRSEARGDDTLVHSNITRPGSPAADVDWLVGTVGGQMKILDVIAEGTSLRQTERSDYTSYLQSHGGNIDALLSGIQAQVSQ